MKHWYWKNKNKFNNSKLNENNEKNSNKEENINNDNSDDLVFLIKNNNIVNKNGILEINKNKDKDNFKDNNFVIINWPKHKIW